MIKKFLLSCFFIVSCQLIGFSITLVKDGVPQASIVIAEGRTSTTTAQFAALELQHTIKLITGAKLPIVDAKNKPAGVQILVGPSSVTEALGFKKADFNNEEYMVKFMDNTIILMGNDSPVYSRVDYQNYRTFPRINGQDKSTLWAVYDFLEQCCDVRWYAPTDVGTTFEPRKTLTVKPISIRRKPAMDAQRQLYAPKFHYERDKPFSNRDNTMLKLHWRNTARFGWTNHNVYSLWYKYWGKAKDPQLAKAFVEKRPEYFARNYGGASGSFLVGSRKQFPNDQDLPPQVCMSNREVIKHFAEEALNGYEGKWNPGARARSPRMPGAPWYYAIVEDDNRAVCGCEGCKKLFAGLPEKERKQMMHFWWVNEIAKEVAKTNPKVGITTLAYGNAMYYPQGLELNPNVGVMMCLGVSNWWHPTVRKRHHDRILKEWSKHSKGRLLQLWSYFLTPGWDAKIIYKYNDFFPCYFATKVGPMFKDFVDKGVRGWFCEINDELGYPLWSDQLESYVACQVCYNPDQDTEKMVEEFFPKYYGAAGKPMREFYRIIEDATWDKNNYPAKWFKNEKYIGPGGEMDSSVYANFYPVEVNWGMLGTKERMAKLAVLIAQAKKLVKTDAEKQRMAWFDKGMWQPMLRGRANYETQEKFFKRPAKEITAKRVKNAGGDPLKVKWEEAASTGAWKSIHGFPDHPGRYMKIANDGKYLYFKFFEPKGAKKLTVDKFNFWAGDTLELFFSLNKNRPYSQFAVNPNGEVYAASYLNENGIDFNGKLDIKAKVINKSDQKGWTVYVALPMDGLIPRKEITPGTDIYANFFRNSSKWKAIVWTPTFTKAFPNLKKMGTVHLEK